MMYGIDESISYLSEEVRRLEALIKEQDENIARLTKERDYFLNKLMDYYERVKKES